jgi:hypothetical protein
MPIYEKFTLDRVWFHEIEPTIRERDGRVLKRYRLLDPVSGPIYVEDPFDQLYYHDIVAIQPYEVPTALVFYLEYQYKGSDA